MVKSGIAAVNLSVRPSVCLSVDRTSLCLLFLVTKFCQSWT